MKKENTVCVTIDGKTKHFKKKIVTIGRNESNNVVLSDQSVSRRHCVIVNYHRDVWLYDLNSTLGTVVDGQRVQEKIFLLGIHGVTVGNAQIQISSEEGLLI